VKRSRHPSALWAHACVPGDAALVRVGGGFVPTLSELRTPLLLLAGGIGITPLASIARHAAELAAARAAAAAAQAPPGLPLPPPHVLLLYCCRAADEFSLLPQLRAAEAASGAHARAWFASSHAARLSVSRNCLSQAGTCAWRCV
jgi:ferredoxin-NADP reductase